MPRVAVFAAVFGVIGLLGLIYAGAVSTSVTYKGTISPSQPKASYQLVTGVGELEAKLTPRNRKNIKMRVSIHDKDGKLLASDDVGKDNKSTIVSVNVAAGEHIVTVSYDGELQSEKGFTLDIAYPIDEVDQEQPDGNKFEGSISPSNPTKQFSLNVASGNIEATLTPNNKKNTKMRISLFDDDGMTLASEDIGSGNTSKTISASVNEGTVIIEVSWDGNIESEKGFTVDVSYPMSETQKPAVAITGPNAGVVSGEVSITASATDASGIQKVEFYAGSTLVGSDTTSSYRAVWDTKNVSNGTHNITAKAFANNGNTSQASIAVTVDNVNSPPPPTIPSEPAPQPTSTSGIWISRDEIMALPMSGDAWKQIESKASGSLPSPDFSDNTNKHDTSTLALAYHAVRTNNGAEMSRVANEIERGIVGGSTSALDFCRNINSYIIAADVVNLKSVDPSFDATFRNFLTKWMFGTSTGLRGHTGDGVRGTASESTNNWGTMCRGSYASAAVYTGNQTELDNITKWHKGWLGDRAAYSGYGFREDQSWHADQNSKKGINSRGATIQGQNVDGVLPEDQRRTGGFEWPAPKGSYPWEAMQGALIADVVLQRAGMISSTYQDSAMLRAYNWLYKVNNNPASGDDEWQMWVVNKYYGTSYSTKVGVSEGKLMGWTDWTHQ